MKLPVYLDHHATTPVDPRVLEAMMPCLTTEFGNASGSVHSYGAKAKTLVDEARKQVARLIGAVPEEIVFTAGATEANNQALKTILEVYASRGRHIITQMTEHKSVLAVCEYLAKNGSEITYLSVDERGRVDLEELKRAIRKDTVLISIMHANNEIGTIQPLAKIGKIAKENKILFHVDAAQSLGKIPFSVNEMGIDLASFSAHKIYGPKGVGALYVRHENPHVSLAAFLHGGGQESGMRSGTLNVPGIVGFGKACEIAMKQMKEDDSRIQKLRDRLEAGLKKELDHVSVHGDPSNRLSNNLSISFSYTEADSLLMAIGSEIAVSSGSACATGHADASHVLKAIHLSGQELHSTVRFGLGRFNTEEEIDFTIKRVSEAVKKLRGMSPLYSAVKNA